MNEGELGAAIVAQASDAIIFADRQGLIRLWNAGAEAVFGYSPGEALGQSLDLIIPQRLRAAHWKAFDEATNSGRTKYGRRAMLTRSAHKSGSKLYVDLSFAIVSDATGEVAGSVAIARHAAQRHASEAALKQRIAELEARPDAHP